MRDTGNHVLNLKRAFCRATDVASRILCVEHDVLRAGLSLTALTGTLALILALRFTVVRVRAPCAITLKINRVKLRIFAPLGLLLPFALTFTFPISWIGPPYTHTFPLRRMAGLTIVHAYEVAMSVTLTKVSGCTTLGQNLR
jgi:hypothetical protein